MSAWLICTLCKCVDFVQVLQLSFSAPLIADFPVGDKRSIMLLKVLSEIADCDGGGPTQHSSSFFIHLHLKRTEERTKSQHKALNSNLCVHVFLVQLSVESFVLSLSNPLKVEQTTDELC